MNFMGADMVASCGARRPVDDTMAPGKHTGCKTGFPKSLCILCTVSATLFLLTSFYLFLSLSLRAMQTVARPISDCAVAARLGPCCHSATVTPTATSAATLAATTTMTPTAAATLPIVSFFDNDVAWRCPVLPPA